MKPTFVLSKNKVLEQFKKVIAISDIVSYSSKTNPLVTQILEKETNSLFSIHMTSELKHIKDMSRVVLLAQALNQNLLNELISKGIKTFIIDNESDLDEILKFIEKNNVNINLMLRLKLKENTIRTERYFVFGMESSVVNKTIKEIRKNEKLKSKIISLGIHFHRKSQNMAEWNLIYEISNSIDEDVMRLIDLMCIGGGLPSEYANTNINVIDSIFKKIIEFKNWLNKNNVKLMIEPGRFIAAPAVKLIVEIIGMHENNIIVNASVYNSDLDALIVPVKLLVEGEVEKGQGKPYVIKGITPCSMDLYRYTVYLKNPKIGDKLIFLNAGAYNFTTDFCDLEKIETEIIE